MASKLVKTFVESLAKKVDMTLRDASSTYAEKTEKIVKEDPRLLKIYDEEDIASAIYNARTGQSNLGVADPARFLDMAAYLPVDRKGYDYIRDVVNKKKQQIAEGVPREQFTFPSLGMRLDDDGLKVKWHDGRHINTAMKEMGYPKGLVEIVPQINTPDLKTLPPDTPVFSESGGFVDDVEIPSKQVGTLGELIKFLGLGGVAAPGVLSQLPSEDSGGKVVE